MTPEVADPASTIDWRLAESTALRLLPNGPSATPQEAQEVVEGLRAAALEAEGPIAEVTALQPLVPKAPVQVVDRAVWARLNVEDMASTLVPLIATMRARRVRTETESVDTDGDTGGRRGAGASSAMVGAIGSRATGFQVGSLLAFVGTKVLGQHELFTPEGRDPRLLLVAPNVLIAERNLGVDPRAFRRWICLHEETHRVQLAAVPWLRDRIEADLQRFFDASDAEGAFRERVGAVVSSIGGAVRGEHGRSLLEAVQTPEQREILDRLVALMTLLEGHADWAMDAVGEDVVPGLTQVRSRFEKRRDGVGALDQVLRRLFGLDAKLAQYREGAAFVREVVELVGIEGLNAAWTSAETLPMREEITDPRRWVDRVHAGVHR
jgi:coenzyme F420 biosynthesis associated uncharacterized protein